MIRHAASYPETPLPVDWRDQAACRGHDQPDMWFASSKRIPEAADAADAKRICGCCPSRPACLAYALDRNEQFGIFGGLDEDERQGLRRGIRKGATTVQAAAAAARPVKPRTLRSIFDQHAARVFGGHLEWVGAPKPSLHGREYTPRQLAFVLDRGYDPTGHVKTTCDHTGCILAAHLMDNEERKRARWAANAPKAVAS